jgi:hypothetical protein
MNFEFILEIFKAIGLGIAIGTASFIVPFGLLILMRILAWYVAVFLAKIPKMRRILKVSEEAYNRFNDKRNNKQVKIYDGHPSQVIKHLREDGLPSLFRDYHSVACPNSEPDTLGNQSTPSEFLNSAHPIPINQKRNNRTDNLSHEGNLSQESEGVNQNGTIPLFINLTLCIPLSFSRRGGRKRRGAGRPS